MADVFGRPVPQMLEEGKISRQRGKQGCQIMSKLMECPFCNSHNVGMVETDGSKYGAIRCNECGAVGLEVRLSFLHFNPNDEFYQADIDAAVREWNWRY